MFQFARLGLLYKKSNFEARISSTEYSLRRSDSRLHVTSPHINQKAMGYWTRGERVPGRRFHARPHAELRSTSQPFRYRLEIGLAKIEQAPRFAMLHGIQDARCMETGVTLFQTPPVYSHVGLYPPHTVIIDSPWEPTPARQPQAP